MQCASSVALLQKRSSSVQTRSGMGVLRKQGLTTGERQGKHLGSMRSPINTQAVNKLAALKTPMNALLSQAVAKDQMTIFNITLLYRAAPPYTQITQTPRGWGLILRREPPLKRKRGAPTVQRATVAAARLHSHRRTRTPHPHAAPPTLTDFPRPWSCFCVFAAVGHRSFQISCR